MNFLKNHAASVGATATAIGGVLYVLLSIISSWVYGPLGVTPSQVGLGYGSLLIGTAALLVWIAFIGAIFVGLALCATWLTARLARWSWLLVALLAMAALFALLTVDAGIAALIAAVAVAAAVGKRWRRRKYLAGSIIGVTVVVIVGVGTILWWANRASTEITAGHRSSGAWSARGQRKWSAFARRNRRPHCAFRAAVAFCISERPTA